MLGALPATTRCRGTLCARKARWLAVGAQCVPEPRLSQPSQGESALAGVLPAGHRTSGAWLTGAQGLAAKGALCAVPRTRLSRIVCALPNSVGRRAATRKRCEPHCHRQQRLPWSSEAGGQTDEAVGMQPLPLSPPSAPIARALPHPTPPFGVRGPWECCHVVGRLAAPPYRCVGDVRTPLPPQIPGDEGAWEKSPGTHKRPYVISADVLSTLPSLGARPVSRPPLPHVSHSSFAVIQGSSLQGAQRPQRDSSSYPLRSRARLPARARASVSFRPPQHTCARPTLQFAVCKHHMSGGPVGPPADMWSRDVRSRRPLRSRCFGG